MSSTIRIKRSGPGKLFFEVHSEGAIPALTSAHYSTICKMEAGLALLFAAARSPGALRMEPDEGAMRIGLKGKRGRVTFVGQLSESMVQIVMPTIASAHVIDDRPPEQRRADLSGRLCDLHH
jgi:hypothetical protein